MRIYKDYFEYLSPLQFEGVYSLIKKLKIVRIAE